MSLSLSSRRLEEATASRGASLKIHVPLPQLLPGFLSGRVVKGSFCFLTRACMGVVGLFFPRPRPLLSPFSGRERLGLSGESATA